jgi:Rab5 GDP/GTP exchange factor
LVGLLSVSGLLKHKESDSSADSFMPLLIYVVLQSNPDHLVSNVQYILRFRNQEKLAGEAGYYLSSLVSPLVQLLSHDSS